MDPSLLKHLVQTSRPRFWLYLTGPYLLVLTWVMRTQAIGWPERVLLALWLIALTCAGNFFVYGINDWFDEATDQYNAKKEAYEQRIYTSTRAMVRIAIVACVLLILGLTNVTLVMLPTSWFWLLVGVGGFLFFGGEYSAPPIRAKAIPFLDSAFNVLYLSPVFIAWSLGAHHLPFPWQSFLAGWLWCMAMHAFSAVPDIEADTKASLRTVATSVGAGATILLCALLYALSAALVYPKLGLLSAVGGSAYLVLMFLAWRRRHSHAQLFSLYTLFPWINTVVGFCLWLTILAKTT